MYPVLGNTEIWLYDFFNMLGALALIIFNIMQTNKKKLFLGKVCTIWINNKSNKSNRTESLCSIFEILLFSICQYAFAGIINKAFGNLANTGSNYFGSLLFSPIIISIACIILGVNIFKQMDLLTPAFPLALFFAKLACFFQGCCNGMEYPYGLYNHKTDAIEFPSQLLEAILALLIFAFIMCRRKKIQEGVLFPTYMIIYSFSRFFTEFSRHEPAIIWYLKTYHLLCIAGLIIGLGELYIVKKHSKKITFICDKLFESLSQRLRNYALKKGFIKEKNIIHHKKRKK